MLFKTIIMLESNRLRSLYSEAVNIMLDLGMWVVGAPFIPLNYGCVHFIVKL
jgi:hypothetical protein